MASLSTAAANAAIQGMFDAVANPGNDGLFFSTFRDAGLQILTSGQFIQFTSPSGGSVTATGVPITYPQGANTGTAALLRLSDLFTFCDITVGGVGSGADIEIAGGATIDTGQSFMLDSLTLSMT